MYWNRFDIVMAHYAFCSDYHAGQDSEEYSRLSRIGIYFTPGAAWKGYQSLTDNAQRIYDLCRERWMEGEYINSSKY